MVGRVQPPEDTLHLECNLTTRLWRSRLEAGGFSFDGLILQRQYSNKKKRVCLCKTARTRSTAHGISGVCDITVLLFDSASKPENMDEHVLGTVVMAKIVYSLKVE